MTSEQVPARAHVGAITPLSRPLPALGWMTAPDWSVSPGSGDERETLGSLEAPQSALVSPPTPVDDDLVEVAADLPPGKALDLGCGAGQNAIWLTQRGWVVTAVDRSPGAIAEAREAAAQAAVTVAFELADFTAWRPVSRYDLVISIFALPTRGMGRSRVLEMAAAAVAPGGSILVRELDVALAREGRMADKYLVSTEEVERHLDGFRVNRSRTRLARHRNGFEEIVVPVATVVATRRADLRTL